MQWFGKRSPIPRSVDEHGLDFACDPGSRNGGRHGEAAPALTRLGEPFPRMGRAAAKTKAVVQEAAGSRPVSLAPLVSVVIPALNEAENLRYVLPTLPQDYEIVIVDGASTDGTIEVALDLRPDAVIVEQDGRGKGDALVQGFMAARGEIIVTLDADGSADSAEIPRFIEALESGADFAKGSRYLSGGGSDDLSRLRSVGNRFLTAVTNILYGTVYTDLCYGYNAFRRGCIPHLHGGPTGFEIETLMHIRAVQAGLRVVEIPSHEARRRFGNSHLRPFRDGFRILCVIVRERSTIPSPSHAAIATHELLAEADP